MKFCKKYQYIRNEGIRHLPSVGFKRFKKILKKCRDEHRADSKNGVLVSARSSSSSHCPDSSFQARTSLQIASSEVSVEILHSPWLNELIAFYINLRETKSSERAIPGLLDGCTLRFDEGKPSLSCMLFDSIQLEIDLTCSICLETVFDAVSLTCGHILCFMCACSAASVTIVDGLKAADPKAKCPLCRQSGVYEESVHLDELNVLLSRSCPEYWKGRLQAERAERVQQAKVHWQNVSRSVIGL